MKPNDIRAIFDDVQRDLSKVADDFPWETQDAYVSWMAQTYEYALATTRILALTGGHIPMHQTSVATRYIQHATEERGHDKLLISDAKALGVDLTKTKIIPEAEAFHKSVYYWIYQGQTPVIMGWVLLLEGFAVLNGPRLFERAEKHYGKKATSFMRVHTAEDPDHVDKAFKALDVYSAKELEEVAHGLRVYAKLYANVYTAIAQAVRSGDAKKSGKAA
ncbi:MAG: iron-containing redox enzyme family protein [Bdellovibrionota bacterium]